MPPETLIPWQTGEAWGSAFSTSNPPSTSSDTGGTQTTL